MRKRSARQFKTFWKDRLGVQTSAFYSHFFMDLLNNDVPGAGFRLLRFSLLFFNRLVLLVEQLARAFRRLAGDVLHRHALAQISLVVRRGEVGGDLQIAHELVVDHHPLGAVFAPALHLVYVDVVDELPQDLIVEINLLS